MGKFMNGRLALGRGSFCLVAALTLALACGDDDRPPPLDNNAGGSGPGGAGGTNPFGGAGGSGGVGGAGADAGSDNPQAPLVEILWPGELSDPNAATPENPVLVIDPAMPAPVKVLCSVKQSTEAGSKAVDEETVKIDLIKADGTVVKGTASATGEAENQYSAEFTMADVPTGAVSFRCTASDVSSPPKSKTDTNATLFDKGPKIEVIRPLRGSAARQKGSVTFEFKVEPAPLTAGDTGAAVGAVGLAVHGKPMQLDPSTGNFVATARFDDPVEFPVAPNGAVTVVITAPNTRTPLAAVGTERYDFNVDGTDPVITVTSHKTFQVVGGIVELVFTVTDALSGVNESTVTVTAGGAPPSTYSVNDSNWTRNGEIFRYKFDSRLIPGAVTQIPINIRAEDKAGNFTIFGGDSLILQLDHQGPSIDLDPENVRELKVINPMTNHCSESFDPLGLSPPNDEERVSPKERLRAFVWDETNSVGSGTLYYARVDTSSVRIYLQANPGSPLLIRSDGDTSKACDSLVQGLPFVDLQGFAPTGEAEYGNDTATLAPALGKQCTLGPATSPPRLCGSLETDMYRVTRHAMSTSDGGERVIYGVGASGVDCVGGFWEYGTTLTEGWKCFAATARDRQGNVGISRPLRLCLDKDLDDLVDPCAGQPPPLCTDGCTAPPRVAARIIRQ
jgi:hypothetical protein